MKVLVSGARGFIGTEVVSRLEAHGHAATRLVRATPRPGEIAWDPARGTLDAAAIEGFDAVVHLAGEPIATGRWNAARKDAIRRSRVEGTRLLATTLARARVRPHTLLAASAIGWYGDRGDEVLHEDSAPGRGFLAEVCREWEAAAEPAAAAGIRVVPLRIGVVLGTAGGALPRMLTPFRLGLGGPVGNGRQYWSWITLDDVAAAALHVLTTPGLRGPVNAVAPGAVTNAEFTRVLARVLRRPAFFPMPAFAARLALGEMANDLLLASARVEPRKLLGSGHVFRHPALEEALRATVA